MTFSLGWIAPLAVLLLSTCVNIDFSTSRDESPVVRVEDSRFEVEVADTEQLIRKGLTGRPYLEERRGMLYIPDGPEAGGFWMKGMQFPLDIIWIGSDCRVVDVNANVKPPPPGTPDDDIRRYRSYPAAAYTLEVNSGEASRFNIRVGDKVEFENIDAPC